MCILIQDGVTLDKKELYSSNTLYVIFHQNLFKRSNGRFDYVHKDKVIKKGDKKACRFRELGNNFDVSF